MTAPALHVVFRVGDADYALPAADVVQMESYAGATAVPGAPQHVAGLIQVRGKVIPVVDARMRFGLPPVEHTLNTRVVVGQVGARTVGLIVDSAREVLKVAPEDFKPPPSAVDHDAAGFVKAVAQVGGRLVLLMDLAKVVGQEQLHGE